MLGLAMKKPSYVRHRFHPSVIQHAVWLYFTFSLSLRDVECMLAERGIDLSYETIRRWTVKFGLSYAKRIRARRKNTDPRWHLDEVFVRMGTESYYLWRAVDAEGEVLDVLVQKRRNKQAAKRLMRKLLRNQNAPPETITTDRLGSYGAAFRELGIGHLQRVGGRSNNRAENSHLPVRRRERKMQRFKSPKSAQIFLSIFGPVYNLFNHQRHLISRKSLKIFREQAFREWRTITATA
jgi:putative transposase